MLQALDRSWACFMVASAETTGSLPSRRRDRRTTERARRDLRPRKSLIQRGSVSGGKSAIDAAAKPRKDRQNLPAVLGIAEQAQILNWWRRERTWDPTFSTVKRLTRVRQGIGWDSFKHAHDTARLPSLAALTEPLRRHGAADQRTQTSPPARAASTTRVLWPCAGNSHRLPCRLVFPQQLPVALLAGATTQASRCSTARAGARLIDHLRRWIA